MKTGSFRTYKGPGRISIARFAPRGTPAGYRQFKALAPGSWFNSVARTRYEELFAKEILGPLDPKTVWDELHTLAAGAEPVLLCYEIPPFDEPGGGKNWCHRRLVAAWFERHLQVKVGELTFGKDKQPLLGEEIDISKPPAPGSLDIKRQGTLFTG
jgi:hypothetical protein